MNNADAGYVDLQNKLNTVYGENQYGTDNAFTETHVWQGENNTAVVLFKQDGFMLYYGTLDAVAILKAALENYVAPSNEVDSSDTSGL